MSQSQYEKDEYLEQDEEEAASAGRRHAGLPPRAGTWSIRPAAGRPGRAAGAGLARPPPA